MDVESALKTPLFAAHETLGGRMVEFGGWLMPVQYTSIVEEHQAVRNHAGLFDISHMGRLEFDGPDALEWIEHVSTNHVARLKVGQIQYSLMPNGGGGLIDDVLVYRPRQGYLVVCNASNRAHVLAQFERHRENRVARLIDCTNATAMLALQGPAAAALLQPHVRRRARRAEVLSLFDRQVRRRRQCAPQPHRIYRRGRLRVDRRGRRGRARLASVACNQACPCGLGARDTLRFEAAMPLYGHELNDAVNPYAAGLGWAVKLDKGTSSAGTL